MQPNEHYPHLFEPIALAGRRLRNRIIHASISTHFMDQAGTHERQVQYLANRARGGAAAIVTEPLGIAPHQPNVRLRVYDDTMEDFGRRWADAVESLDCRLLGQIQDAGRGRHTPGRNPNAIGASAEPDDISWTMPHAMSTGEIRAFIDRAADASARLKRWGFSGVEISAGHGHLFHQFLSPQSNHREDEYGGPLENRVRFLRELCLAVRSVTGGSFILGVKLPGDDGVPGGVDPAMAAEIAAHLVSGVTIDYLAYCQGAHHRTLEMHLPNDSYPRLPYVPMIRELAKATPGVPVMALGRITDPAEAEGILARRDLALIGLARPLVTDPAWPAKAQAGRARDIRYCVNNNTCWKIGVGHAPFACDNNPRLGLPDEVDFTPSPASARRRVVVIGAGVAGLEAAWTAAARGHDVMVFGVSSEVGGKARLHARLPNSESLSSVYDYQLARAQRHGVRFQLGQHVNAARILKERPDAVILATGASMVWPSCLPVKLRDLGLVPDLRSAMRDLEGLQERQRGRAVILDMDHTEGTYAAADRLHELFDEVIVLTPRERIAEDVALVTRQGILRRFHRKRIRWHSLVEPVWSDAFENESRLDYASVYGGTVGHIDDVAFFAYATPRRPNDELAAPLREAGIEVRLVGDCKVARHVVDATQEGHAAGMSV
jgi:2,4-dienoyl-CoA reductase-like NADH-dependent reductase (Old Yellow Enzyme family)